MQRTQEKANGRWVSLGVASYLLGVNKSTLRDWADLGLIRTFRTPGGHRRFSQEDITRLVEGRTPGDQGEATAQWSDTALRRIRRRLHRPNAEAYPWQAKMDDEGKERLRLSGRRLLQLTAEYSSQRRSRPDLLAEARLIGKGHGREMGRQGIPLEEATQAYVFFRNSFIGIAAETWESQEHPVSELAHRWKRGSAFLDGVLVAMIASYREAVDTSG